MTNFNIELFGEQIFVSLASKSCKNIVIDGIGVIDKIIDDDGTLLYLVIQVQIISTACYDAIAVSREDLALIWKGCRIPVRVVWSFLEDFPSHDSHEMGLKLELRDLDD